MKHTQIIFITLLLFAYALCKGVNPVTLFQQSIQQNRQCSAIRYGSLGDSCEPGRSLRRCKAFLQCHEYTYTCQPGHVGASCELDSDCFLNEGTEEGIRCVQGRCIKPKYSGFGCEYNEDCFTGRCENGICVGKPEGADCNSQNYVECDKGLYCSRRTQKCVKQLNEGDACYDYTPKNDNEIEDGENFNVICKGGLKCMGGRTDRTCTVWRDGKEGTRCNYQRHRHDQCEFGLYCIRGVCTKYEPPEDIYDIPCPNTVNGRNCSSELNEECICAQEGGDGKNSCRETFHSATCDYVRDANEWRDCSAEHNCPFDGNVWISMMGAVLDKHSCLGKNCNHIARRFLCCSMSGYKNAWWTISDTGPLNCGSNAGWVVVLIVLLVLVSIGIVATITSGVVIYRKKFAQASFQQIH